jgi:hypothetical protein
VRERSDEVPTIPAEYFGEPFVTGRPADAELMEESENRLRAPARPGWGAGT